jgi:glutamate--glyoxylate aminotransferase
MLCCGVQERESELASLRRRAHMVTDGFNELEDVTCNFTEGAMYSFPQVRDSFYFLRHVLAS